MTLWEVKNGEALVEVPPSTFSAQGWSERGDLQRYLRDHPNVLEDDLFIVDEEHGHWADSRRRIDLLAIDSVGRLVVVELKRDDSLDMDLQSVRYAAMVANMTVEMAIEAHRRYRTTRGLEGDSDEIIRDRLARNPKASDQLDSERPRIILASSDFGRELTTTVLWLNEVGLDIRCIRVRPYSVGDRVLLDVEQLIPLVGAEEYMVRAREKQREVAGAEYPNVPWTEVDFSILYERVVRYPALQAMFDLCSERPDTFVSLSEILERSHQTHAQARGALARLTVTVRTVLNRDNLPVELKWPANGDGQVSYRLTTAHAAWWQKARDAAQAGA